MFTESRTRSLAKALSWRLLGTAATCLVVFVFTRRLALSLAVGGFEFVSKVALFWLHERAWDRIPLGKRSPDAMPAVGSARVMARVADEAASAGGDPGIASMHTVHGTTATPETVKSAG